VRRGDNSGHSLAPASVPSRFKLQAIKWQLLVEVSRGLSALTTVALVWRVEHDAVWTRVPITIEGSYQHATRCEPSCCCCCCRCCCSAAVSWCRARMA
jgi:hypothetical protein